MSRIPTTRLNIRLSSTVGVLLILIVLGLLISSAACEPATNQDVIPTATSADTPRLSLIINTPDRSCVIIEPGAPQYAEVKSMLPPPDPNFQTDYRISNALCDEIWTLLPPLSPEDQARRERWSEKSYHWDNIDAFNASIQKISKDRVIDRDESYEICFLLEQWVLQLTEAKEYIEDYREAEPDYVAETPILYKLEAEAIRGLELLANVECE